MLSDIIKNIIKIDLKDILHHDFPLNQPFGLEINHNGIIYDFIVRLSSSNKNLICFGSGHNGRNQRDSKNNIIKPPYLNRWSYYQYFNESVISYADPSFFRDDTITLGWYVGGEEWYLKTISNIIRLICIKQNIQQNNILFYGSSGGGFASIALATLIKDSKALVNNSSYDVKDITDQHYINLMNYLKKEFGNLSEKEIWKLYKHRLNLNSLFLQMKYVPEICMYTNICSPLDFEKRTKFFLKDLFKNPFFKNNLTLQYYYEPEAPNNGHNAMIHNHERDVIKLFAKANLYNTEEKASSYLKLLDNLNENSINKDIFDNIIKYNTARFDIKNIGSENNLIEILETSDEQLKIMTPDWFCGNDGVGYLLESHKNKIKILLKCINDGELKISLKSKYVHDKNKTNFPIYLDYIKFQVNNQDILENKRLVHCFNPYVYKKNVKNNEIITLEIQWLPFNSDSLLI